VVLVTHDERLAARGDRTITLEDGRIVGERVHSAATRAGDP